MGTKLIVCGAAGRMGRRIISLAVEDGGFDIVGAVETAGHGDIGKDAGLVAGVSELKVSIGDSYPAGADVLIDFSQPQGVDKTIEYCLGAGVGLVLGTTGLSESQIEKIKSAGEKIGVIYGTNMSVAMNVLFSLVGKVASMLGEDYDIEIIEQHHRFKKDAPSGSALTLAQNICEQTGRGPDCLVHGRSGNEAVREKGTIGMHAVRAGDIVGIHSVIFSTLGETLTLRHDAGSRDTFAYGSLRAAKWLVGKKAGLYSMAQCLGIE